MHLITLVSFAYSRSSLLRIYSQQHFISRVKIMAVRKMGLDIQRLKIKVTAVSSSLNLLTLASQYACIAGPLLIIIKFLLLKPKMKQRCRLKWQPRSITAFLLMQQLAQSLVNQRLEETLHANFLSRKNANNLIDNYFLSGPI